MGYAVKDLPAGNFIEDWLVSHGEPVALWSDSIEREEGMRG